MVLNPIYRLMTPKHMSDFCTSISYHLCNIFHLDIHQALQNLTWTGLLIPPPHTHTLVLLLVFTISVNAIIIYLVTQARGHHWFFSFFHILIQFICQSCCQIFALNADSYTSYHLHHVIPVYVTTGSYLVCTTGSYLVYRNSFLTENPLFSLLTQSILCIASRVTFWNKR